VAVWWRRATRWARSAKRSAGPARRRARWQPTGWPRCSPMDSTVRSSGCCRAGPTDGRPGRRRGCCWQRGRSSGWQGSGGCLAGCLPHHQRHGGGQQAQDRPPAPAVVGLQPGWPLVGVAGRKRDSDTQRADGQGAHGPGGKPSAHGSCLAVGRRRSTALAQPYRIRRSRRNRPLATASRKPPLLWLGRSIGRVSSEVRTPVRGHSRS
jgi:hypothetical protein